MKNLIPVFLAAARPSDRATGGVAASVFHFTFTPVELLGLIAVITVFAAIGLV